MTVGGRQYVISEEFLRGAEMALDASSSPMDKDAEVLQAVIAGEIFRQRNEAMGDDA